MIAKIGQTGKLYAISIIQQIKKEYLNKLTKFILNEYEFKSVKTQQNDEDNYETPTNLLINQYFLEKEMKINNKILIST